MIRHLLKLVWRRRRANALVAAEIFFSFLVVFAVLTMTWSFIARWNEPLGFDAGNVWIVRIDVSEALESAGENALLASLDRLIRQARSLPQIVDAAASSTPPYSLSRWEGTWVIDGRRIEMTRDEVTDDFAKVMKLHVVRGRWFRPEDDAMSFQPIVIDTDLARAMYGNEDPLGKKFDPQTEGERRVVGVIAPYRKDGEISGKMNMAFQRVSFRNAEQRAPRNVVVRVRAGTPPVFEEELTRSLHGIAPTIAVRVQRMDAMRTFLLRLRLTPLIVAAIVAAFLMAMVSLGLSGVLWQSVTRRTRELGLRRALGATGAGVRAQIVGEVAVLATLAMAIGVAIVLQLPLLGAFRLVTPSVFAFGVVASLAVIYIVTLLCAIYPGWLASRVLPADALRYE